MPVESPDAFLAHVLQVLRPYLDRLVLVGGFAARLYALHPQAVLLLSQSVEDKGGNPLADLVVKLREGGFCLFPIQSVIKIGRQTLGKLAYCDLVQRTSRSPPRAQPA